MEALKCTKCDFTTKPGRYAPQELGRHLKFAHNIDGKSKTAVSNHKLQHKPRIRRPKKEHSIVKAPTAVSTHNHHAEGETQRLQAAATLAAGRCIQLCESLAVQQDLPPKSLTALVVGIVHATTLR